MLMQRSKAIWIRLGDHNSKYFLSLLRKKRLQQSITQLKDAENQMQHDQRPIGNTLVAYYQCLLGDAGRTRTKSRPKIYEQAHRLTEEQQLLLLGVVMKEEIKKTIWSMNIN